MSDPNHKKTFESESVMNLHRYFLLSASALTLVACGSDSTSPVLKTPAPAAWFASSTQCRTPAFRISGLLTLWTVCPMSNS